MDEADEAKEVSADEKSFFSVDFMIVVALLLSIALVGYNSLLLPDYEPPEVTYPPVAEAVVATSEQESKAELAQEDVFTVNVNTASSEELQRVPGIGPAMASKIIEYRNRVGVITTMRELLNVSGIGEKKLADFLQYFVLE